MMVGVFGMECLGFCCLVVLDYTAKTVKNYKTAINHNTFMLSFVSFGGISVSIYKDRLEANGILCVSTQNTPI